MLVEHFVFVVDAVDAGLCQLGRCNISIEILIGKGGGKLSHPLAAVVAERDECHP